MPEFLELLPPPEALGRLLEVLPVDPKTEQIETADALGRVTSDAVSAPIALPSFTRSTVDGYAVSAADTFGASESLPAYLTLAGEILMGEAATIELQRGSCVLIHTGGMLPQGADAVVMLEYTQAARAGEIEVLRAVAEGENVLKVGEDVQVGQHVIPAGTSLRPAEIGGLMGLGITSLRVACKPRVGILSSGDEIITPGEPIGPGQVYDINAFTLSALVEQSGGIAVRYGIIPDNEAALTAVAEKALTECDVVVITAGSSASARDLTSTVINRLGSPGVLVHGVNIRPGKPTILAVCEGKAVIGLPGNPVSALVIASLFVRPVITALLGLTNPHPRPRIRARLTLNLASRAGREDWIPVRLSEEGEQFLAEPVFGKSNLIFTLARADGLVRIHPDANGVAGGEWVDVWLF